MRKLLLLTWSLVWLGAVAQDESEPLRRAEAAVTDIMVHDIFSPPVASRIYLYTNLAAYETLVKTYPGYSSLHGQVRNFPMIPAPDKKIAGPLAAVYAFLQVGKRLVFSDSVMQDSIRAILRDMKTVYSPKVYAASLEYGTHVANVIMSWADADQYKETRKLPRYRIARTRGKWIPTPPVYMAAVEPYWGKIRPVTLDSADQFRPPAAPPFSTDTGSLFYHQAYEVYTAVNQLTTEQRNIANFWDCNPFAVTMEGHVGYAVKKISPGGHWLNIVTTISRQQHKGIMETSAAYTVTAIAIFDAFISCWDEKYRSNVIRPETYIDSYIAEGWRPVLQTPPFPEYTSGHSIVSSVAAAVLTNYFGDACAFYDDTEVEFGLPVRHYGSLWQAANEAAISRFYGGIHYHAAIETGQVSGRQIGEWVLMKIKLKKQ